MEIKEKNSEKIVNGLLIAILFVAIFIFQFWLEPQSDFPHTDEYQSILSALGFPTYTPNLYVQMLTFFSGVFSDFYSLVKFNFIASHLLLAHAFFAYHWKRGVALATNLFFTSVLALSTINIALTRKMHFWAAAFFFLILVGADFFEGRSKRLYLLLGLLVLGLFRVEFLFSAAVALALFLCEILTVRFDKKKLIIIIFFIGSALAYLGITTFGYGMKDLLIESFKMGKGVSGPFGLIFTWIKLLISNIGLYGYYTLVSFLTTLRIYLPTLAIAFASLFFLINQPKNNLEKMKTIFLAEYLPFYVPAIFALFSVRFMDFYIIMAFVLFLSLLSFLLNTKSSVAAAPIIALLVLPAFFVHRPELKGSAYINFPTYKRGERVHRQMFDIIKGLNVNSGDAPYKILFNQYVAGVLPMEGREYFMNNDLPEVCKRGPVHFDVVLLTGNWFPEPQQKLIESCVLRGMSRSKHIKLSPGYDLYLSDRVTLEKMTY